MAADIQVCGTLYMWKSPCTHGDSLLELWQAWQEVIAKYTKNIYDKKEQLNALAHLGAHMGERRTQLPKNVSWSRPSRQT